MQGSRISLICSGFRQTMSKISKYSTNSLSNRSGFSRWYQTKRGGKYLCRVRKAPSGRAVRQVQYTTMSQMFIARLHYRASAGDRELIVYIYIVHPTHALFTLYNVRYILFHIYLPGLSLLIANRCHIFVVERYFGPRYILELQLLG